MKIQKHSKDKVNETWATVADDRRGGGSIEIRKDGSCFINMTAGKYGTIDYVVKLESSEVKRLVEKYTAETTA
jgi:hypothetical protein